MLGEVAWWVWGGEGDVLLAPFQHTMRLDSRSCTHSNPVKCHALSDAQPELAVTKGSSVARSDFVH